MISINKNGLQVVPSKNNLGNKFNNTTPASKAISFVGRRQTDSTFKFSVDLSFTPIRDGQEAGVTAFLTQYANVQLGLTQVNDSAAFRFNSTEFRNKYTPIPEAWKGHPVRLMIEMCTPDKYLFSAALAAGGSETLELGQAATSQVSGNTGSFVGTLIGVYATCNGAGDDALDCPAGTPNAWYKRWRYNGLNQGVDKGISVASEGFNQRL
jgi:beta-xylosidase